MKNINFVKDCGPICEHLSFPNFQLDLYQGIIIYILNGASGSSVGSASDSGIWKQKSGDRSLL